MSLSDQEHLFYFIFHDFFCSCSAFSPQYYDEASILLETHLSSSHSSVFYLFPFLLHYRKRKTYIISYVEKELKKKWVRWDDQMGWERIIQIWIGVTLACFFLSSFFMGKKNIHMMPWLTKCSYIHDPFDHESQQSHEIM